MISTVDNIFKWLNGEGSDSSSSTSSLVCPEQKKARRISLGIAIREWLQADSRSELSFRRMMAADVTFFGDEEDVNILLNGHKAWKREWLETMFKFPGLEYNNFVMDDKLHLIRLN